MNAAPLVAGVMAVLAATWSSGEKRIHAWSAALLLAAGLCELLGPLVPSAWLSRYASVSFWFAIGAMTIAYLDREGVFASSRRTS